MASDRRDRSAGDVRAPKPRKTPQQLVVKDSSAEDADDVEVPAQRWYQQQIDDSTDEGKDALWLAELLRRLDVAVARKWQKEKGVAGGGSPPLNARRLAEELNWSDEGRALQAMWSGAQWPQSYVIARLAVWSGMQHEGHVPAGASTESPSVAEALLQYAGEVEAAGHLLESLERERAALERARELLVQEQRRLRNQQDG